MKTGEVCGQVIVKDGGSMAGGSVLFFRAENAPPPDLALFLRVPSIIREILPNGTFCTELPVGEFYFIALKRNSGKKFGKPQKGDYWFRYREENSPNLKKISIREGQHFDFGVLEALPRLGKKVLQPAADTSIGGTIRDMDGNPVENVTVFAFPTSTMLGQKPLFASDFTGKDGKYTLHVAGGNTYYLMARNVMGGGQVK